MTVIVGLISGVVYMAVDYGIFHLLTHSRTISDGCSMLWVLLWMSVNYGFTNFAWIWLWISRDKYLLEWSTLILCWWFCCPMLAQAVGAGQEPIVIQRTTGAYYGYMALILLTGYLAAIIYNLFQKNPRRRVNIPWILAIGILVQFGWEAGLLIGGIRSAGFTLEEKISPLIFNFLLETNLGMPTTYFTFVKITSKFTEQLKKREHPISFTERIDENNAERVWDCQK